MKTGKGGCCSTISNLSRSKLRIGLLRHTLSAVGSVLVGGGGGVHRVLLTIPYFRFVRELHLLPQGIEGSWRNSSEVGKRRDGANTTVTLGLPPTD